MNDAPSQSQDKFIVRLPNGMREMLRAEAEANNRSMNAEIVLALSYWLSRPITEPENRPSAKMTILDLSDLKSLQQTVEATIRAFEEAQKRRDSERSE